MLAIDQSTSATKAVLFDAAGKLSSTRLRASIGKSIRSRAGSSTMPKRFGRTCWPWSANWRHASASELAQAAGLAITNQRETVVVFDRKTGRPLANAIVWQCRRGDPICREMAAAELRECHSREDRTQARHLFFRLEAQVADARAARHSREARRRRRAHRHDRHLSDLSSHRRRGVCHRSLERQPDAVVRHSLACSGTTSSAGCSTCPKWRWPKCARVSPGLARRTWRGALPTSAADLRRDGRLASVALCAAVLRARHGEGDVWLRDVGHAEHRRLVSDDEPRGGCRRLAWIHQGQPTYALEGLINYSSATIAWLKDQLGLIHDAAETDALARSVEDNGGVYLVPAFAGLSAPYWSPTPARRSSA